MGEVFKLDLVSPAVPGGRCLMVLASDYDALQRENACLHDLNVMAFASENKAHEDRLRAERELAEAREKYQHTEDEKSVLSMDLAMALERERECEEAILGAMPLMDDWDESREWRELPAVVRALKGAEK